MFIFIPLGFTFNTIRGFFIIPIKTIYEFDGTDKKFTINQNTRLKESIVKEYGFDRINQILLNKNCIILQFKPDYNYPIDEFINFEYGEKNFKIIEDFLKSYQ